MVRTVNTLAHIMFHVCSKKSALVELEVVI